MDNINKLTELLSNHKSPLVTELLDSCVITSVAEAELYTKSKNIFITSNLYKEDYDSKPSAVNTLIGCKGLEYTKWYRINPHTLDKWLTKQEKKVSTVELVFPEGTSESGEIKPGQVFKHFKGDYYQILQVATHTETSEKLVIYQRMKDGTVWARPEDMFLSPVDKKKYPLSFQTYRFQRVKF